MEQLLSTSAIRFAFVFVSVIGLVSSRIFIVLLVLINSFTIGLAAIIVVIGIIFWKKYKNTKKVSETEGISNVILSKNAMKMDRSILFLGIAGMIIIIATILNRYVVEFSRIHENFFNWTFTDSMLTIGLILALSAYTVSKLHDGRNMT